MSGICKMSVDSLISFYECYFILQFHLSGDEKFSLMSFWEPMDGQARGPSHKTTTI